MGERRREGAAGASASAARGAQPEDVADRLGVCQWFHYGDERMLRASVEALAELGVRHLRTGISWADFHRPEGQAWYDLQMRVLAEAGLETLVSVWHTPPSISLDPPLLSSAVPPASPERFAHFIDQVIQLYGWAIDSIEIWNEPNNPYKWNPKYDPDYARFAELVCRAGSWSRQCGKPTVFGGVTLIDHGFMDAMRRGGAFDHVDVLGIHAFPDMWEPFATSWDQPDHWFGWPHRIETMSELAGGLPVWVTETGLATYDKRTGRRERHALQARRLAESSRAPAERAYWYSLIDLASDRLAVEEANGGPREGAEYHMGLIEYPVDGPWRTGRKPAFEAMRRLLASPLVVEGSAVDLHEP